MTAHRGPYIIATSAHNEADRLPAVVDVVRSQTLLPLRWVIVSDGSTDGTDDYLRRLSKELDWVLYLRREKTPEEMKRIEKAAPGKARAIAMAWKAVENLAFAFFANLDADVTFQVDYYEQLVARLEENPRLGIAGGALTNVLLDGTPAPGGFSKTDYVAGAVQTFRRECFQQIGGYRPYGHEDGIAVEMAKKLGWQVRSFPELPVLHHVRPMGYEQTIKSKVPTCFYLGKMHYVCRVPLWKAAGHVARRVFQKPRLVAGVAMAAGYVWAVARRAERIPRDLGQGRLI